MHSFSKHLGGSRHAPDRGESITTVPSGPTLIPPVVQGRVSTVKVAVPQKAPVFE